MADVEIGLLRVNFVSLFAIIILAMVKISDSVDTQHESISSPRRTTSKVNNGHSFSDYRLASSNTTGDVNVADVMPSSATTGGVKRGRTTAGVNKSIAAGRRESTKRPTTRFNTKTFVNSTPSMGRNRRWSASSADVINPNRIVVSQPRNNSSVSGDNSFTNSTIFEDVRLCQEEECRENNSASTDAETVVCTASDCPINVTVEQDLVTILCPSSDCDCRTLHSSTDISVRCTQTAVAHQLPVFQDVEVTFASVSVARLNLSHIPDRSFVQIRTRVLDLSGNLLAKNGFAEDAFAGLETILQVLSLSECGLARIPNALSKLSQLSTIHLDGNHLNHIRKASFKRNPKLRQLFLQRSGVERIDVGAFEGLKLLQELKLSNNELSSMPSRLLAPLSNLTSLDLSNNFIYHIASGTFDQLSNLQFLELRSNLLHFVTRNMFHGLTGLHHLQLDNNPLLALDNNTFSDLRKLKYLSLDVASNTNITGPALKGLGRLKTLSFGTISRASLPKGLFESMRSLRHLSVQDGRGTFKGFTVDLFRHDMNFQSLNIWAGAIHHCRCSTDWIRELVARGATVHGSCGLAQLIQCS